MGTAHLLKIPTSSSLSPNTSAKATQENPTLQQKPLSRFITASTCVYRNYISINWCIHYFYNFKEELY